MVTINMAVAVGLMLVIFVAGLALGWLIGLPKPTGSFTINHSDPTKDLCTLELGEDLDKVESRKTLTLKVVTLK